MSLSSILHFVRHERAFRDPLALSLFGLSAAALLAAGVMQVIL